MPDWVDGAPEILPDDDKENASRLANDPPRRPRDVLAEPVRSFHSNTFPLWSNVP